MKIKFVILTHNEEIHIGRCIESALRVSNDVLVIDSFSTDRTVNIAREYGVQVLKNVWTNHANQFNWALNQITDDVDWIFRLDADEVISKELELELNSKLPHVSYDVKGLSVKRKIIFQKKLIEYGGLHNINIVRLFRHGHGACEQRWMDEHIIVNGRTERLAGSIIDNNLNNLTYWIDKHNIYACKEAVDLLNIEFQFQKSDSIACIYSNNPASVKRWFKEKLYVHFPPVIRPGLYFVYRFFILLGFLDGKRGFNFHYLQGFWYRYLVDLKIIEVKEHMSSNNSDAIESIRKVLNINL